MTPRAALCWALLPLAAAACTEQPTAPGVCPDFCPADSIHVQDTILADVILRDSAFSGYLRGHESEALAVAHVPAVVDSRAIFVMNQMPTRQFPVSGDTVGVPITVDSSWVRLLIVRRDTNASNLWIKLYRLPLTLDSNTTFDSVTADFNAAPLDSVNLDSLLAQTVITDTALTKFRDSLPYRIDSAGHFLQLAADSTTMLLTFPLDTLRAPFVVADSGRLGFGVRVAGDTLASIALGAKEAGSRDPSIRRFFHYQKMIDSTTDSTVYAVVQRQTSFDSFVFDPPSPGLDSGALDSTLVVGGVPSVRTFLRVAIPDFLRDTGDVVRATLVLVPVAPVSASPGDSFSILARPVVTDIGPKSPLSPNAALWGQVVVRPGSADTLRMEVTDMVRGWAFDTTASPAMVLGQVPEAASYTQVRFFSSRASSFRPALHVTYVRRFPFGRPSP